MNAAPLLAPKTATEPTWPHLVCLAVLLLALVGLIAVVGEHSHHTSLSDYQEDIEAARDRGDDDALRRAQHQLAVLTGEDDLPPQCRSRDPEFPPDQPQPKKP